MLSRSSVASYRPTPITESGGNQLAAGSQFCKLQSMLGARHFITAGRHDSKATDFHALEVKMKTKQ